MCLFNCTGTMSRSSSSSVSTMDDESDWCHRIRRTYYTTPYLCQTHSLQDLFLCQTNQSLQISCSFTQPFLHNGCAVLLGFYLVHDTFKHSKTHKYWSYRAKNGREKFYAFFPKFSSKHNGTKMTLSDRKKNSLVLNLWSNVVFVVWVNSRKDDIKSESKNFKNIFWNYESLLIQLFLFQDLGKIE